MAWLSGLGPGAKYYDWRKLRSYECVALWLEELDSYVVGWPIADEILEVHVHVFHPHSEQRDNDRP